MAVSLKPGVDFQDAQRAWFIHNGTAYSVKDAPTAVFKLAVLARMPEWRQCVQYSRVLKKAEMDMVTRWWLLCCLKDVRKAMKLYASREEAEQELSSIPYSHTPTHTRVLRTE